MSEQILNQGSMYESIQGIQELNQVEGFDPRKYMRQLAGDGQGVKYYLDVVPPEVPQWKDCKEVNKINRSGSDCGG